MLSDEHEGADGTASRAGTAAKFQANDGYAHQGYSREYETTDENVDRWGTPANRG